MNNHKGWCNLDTYKANEVISRDYPTLKAYERCKDVKDAEYIWKTLVRSRFIKEHITFDNINFEEILIHILQKGGKSCPGLLI